MTDLAHIDIPALELGLRGVAVGAFAATGVSLAASRKMTPTRWVGVFLMASAVSHAFESHFYYTRHQHFSFLTWLLSSMAAGVFWLFCSVLFEDEPKIPPWRLVVPGVALALWLPGAFLPPSPARAVAWWIFAAYSLGIHFHILLMTWRGWRIDLVERRRRLRAPIAAAATGYMLIQTLCDFGLGNGPVLPSLAQAAAQALLGIGSALALLRAEPVLVQASAAASAAPAPKSAEPLDLTPADRLVLARLDKAMNQNEVWRGEDLSIGTLAALVGAPEHRLRKLINGTLGHRNFADYVNGRRIEAAKIALADPEQALKSVSTIAYELGFASLGPFNRAFRAATGVTPTAWRQEATPALPRLRLIESDESPPKTDKRA
ncbi:MULTISPECIES: AraC family transcriptional regulator [Caulobacter]|jgi:AraC-like DNA-binding protein|uniref:Transcriptional regulator, AraC family n=1 Tax=Caulobacter vibrioides OR37 TaxID=1292034 RepID=R0D594_CAUVI|nr:MULTISPECIES: AraC family transcriptional regulator [Caulobacter]ENZ83565.1 transcriptional regulator, AraC family [Caulobacter vibrioides OR37]MBQ1561404.1 helix-turn-helix transcriptional regulator [Caulobacter sp.]